MEKNDTDVIDLETHTINVHNTYYRCWNSKCRFTKGRRYLCVHKTIDAPGLEGTFAICPDCSGCYECAVKYAQYKSRV